ncbi:tRNA guanine-N7-methyltransferase [Sarcoptes scabiei]|nr:tRNA guanine-N7-methyltransferase [Sarcoptes scabiei]
MDFYTDCDCQNNIANLLNNDQTDLFHHHHHHHHLHHHATHSCHHHNRKNLPSLNGNLHCSTESSNHYDRLRSHLVQHQHQHSEQQSMPYMSSASNLILTKNDDFFNENANDKTSPSSLSDTKLTKNLMIDDFISCDENHFCFDRNRIKPSSASSSSSTTRPTQAPTVSNHLDQNRFLILLTAITSLLFGLVHCLITIDRYIYGPWTFIGLAFAFMLSAFSIYWAQALVQQFGPNRIITFSMITVLILVLGHYFSNFVLYQIGLQLFASFIGPYYAAQLEISSIFIINLIYYMTPTMKRYHEERYQRLLHLLLSSPTRIFGHLVYVIMFMIISSYTKSSSRSASSTNSSSSSSSSSSPPSLMLLSTNHRENASYGYVWNETDYVRWPNAYQSTLNDFSSKILSSPHCLQSFQQQYCDRALYYIFSFQHHQIQSFKAETNHQNQEPSLQQWQQFDHDVLMLMVTIFFAITLILFGSLLILFNRFDPYRSDFLKSLDPSNRLLSLFPSHRHHQHYHHHHNQQQQQQQQQSQQYQYRYDHHLQQSSLKFPHRNYSNRVSILFKTFHYNHLRFLLPMAFFLGLEQGFFMSDYNKLYVSCSLGLESIGTIMLTRGIVHLAATMLINESIRHIQRPLILGAGTICQLAVLAILCLWRPNDDVPLYYVITMCWSIANAILETLLLSNVLRTLCADEWKHALLSLYSMSFLGFGAAFGMSEFICLHIKLWFLILVLIGAFIPMNFCELRIQKFDRILGSGSQSHI